MTIEIGKRYYTQKLYREAVLELRETAAQQPADLAAQVWRVQADIAEHLASGREPKGRVDTTEMIEVLNEVCEQLRHIEPAPASLEKLLSVLPELASIAELKQFARVVSQMHNARKRLAQQDFVQARQIVTQAKRDFPGALWLNDELAAIQESQQRIDTRDKLTKQADQLLPVNPQRAVLLYQQAFDLDSNVPSLSTKLWVANQIVVLLPVVNEFGEALRRSDLTTAHLRLRQIHHEFPEHPQLPEMERALQQAEQWRTHFVEVTSSSNTGDWKQALDSVDVALASIAAQHHTFESSTFFDPPRSDIDALLNLQKHAAEENRNAIAEQSQNILDALTHFDLEAAAARCDDARKRLRLDANPEGTQIVKQCELASDLVSRRAKAQEHVAKWKKSGEPSNLALLRQALEQFPNVLLIPKLGEPITTTLKQLQEIVHLEKNWQRIEYDSSLGATTHIKKMVEKLSVFQQTLDANPNPPVPWPGIAETRIAMRDLASQLESNAQPILITRLAHNIQSYLDAGDLKGAHTELTRLENMTPSAPEVTKWRADVARLEMHNRRMQTLFHEIEIASTPAHHAEALSAARNELDKDSPYAWTKRLLAEYLNTARAMEFGTAQLTLLQVAFSIAHEIALPNAHQAAIALVVQQSLNLLDSFKAPLSLAANELEQIKSYLAALYVWLGLEPSHPETPKWSERLDALVLHCVETMDDPQNGLAWLDTFLVVGKLQKRAEGYRAVATQLLESERVLAQLEHGLSNLSDQSKALKQIEVNFHSPSRRPNLFPVRWEQATRKYQTHANIVSALVIVSRNLDDARKLLQTFAPNAITTPVAIHVHEFIEQALDTLTQLGEIQLAWSKLPRSTAQLEQAVEIWGRAHVALERNESDAMVDAVVELNSVLETPFQNSAALERLAQAHFHHTFLRLLDAILVNESQATECVIAVRRLERTVSAITRPDQQIILRAQKLSERLAELQTELARAAHADKLMADGKLAAERRDWEMARTQWQQALEFLEMEDARRNECEHLEAVIQLRQIVALPSLTTHELGDAREQVRQLDELKFTSSIAAVTQLEHDTRIQFMERRTLLVQDAIRKGKGALQSMQPLRVPAQGDLTQRLSQAQTHLELAQNSINEAGRFSTERERIELNRLEHALQYAIQENKVIEKLKSAVLELNLVGIVSEVDAWKRWQSNHARAAVRTVASKRAAQ